MGRHSWDESFTKHLGKILFHPPPLVGHSVGSLDLVYECELLNVNFVILNLLDGYSISGC